MEDQILLHLKVFNGLFFFVFLVWQKKQKTKKGEIYGSLKYLMTKSQTSFWGLNDQIHTMWVYADRCIGRNATLSHGGY